MSQLPPGVFQEFWDLDAYPFLIAAGVDLGLFRTASSKHWGRVAKFRTARSKHWGRVAGGRARPRPRLVVVVVVFFSPTGRSVSERLEESWCLNGAALAATQKRLRRKACD